MDSTTAKLGAQASLIAVSLGISPRSVRINGIEGQELNVTINNMAITDESLAMAGFATSSGNNEGESPVFSKFTKQKVLPRKNVAAIRFMLSQTPQISEDCRIILLPAEIWCRILDFAMFPEAKAFRLTCLTNEMYKPNVAMGLLTVNREVYHEATKSLFENTIFIRHYGSNLKPMVDSLELSSLRKYGSKSLVVPQFHELVFELGADFAGEDGSAKLRAFICALRQLRKPINVKKFNITVKACCFDGDPERAQGEINTIAQALSIVNVSKAFILEGQDDILYHDLRVIPANLKMNCQPVDSEFVGSRRIDFTDGFSHTTDGSFSCEYKRAATLGDVSPKKNQVITDAISKFKEYKETVEGLKAYRY